MTFQDYQDQQQLLDEIAAPTAGSVTAKGPAALLPGPDKVSGGVLSSYPNPGSGQSFSLPGRQVEINHGRKQKRLDLLFIIGFLLFNLALIIWTSWRVLL